MTMYITVATTDRVVQASDRRITTFRNGIIAHIDDDTNKAVVVSCHIGNFCVAYSGLAIIRKATTESVIAEIFSSIIKKSRSPKSLFDHFTTELSDKFSSTGIPQNFKYLLKTDISIAGYLHTGALFYLRISNCKDKNKNEIGLQKSFNYYGRLVENPNHRDKTKGIYVEIGGISAANDQKIREEVIRPLSRVRFFHRTSSETISKKLVEIIREFSQQPESNGYVGQNVMITVLHASPKQNNLFQYYDARNKPIKYSPQLVFDGARIGNMILTPL